MNHYAKPKPTATEKRFALHEAFAKHGENDICWVCKTPGTPTNESPCRVCGFPTPEGHLPMSQTNSQPVMPVALLSWRSVKRNTLRGFAEVRIGKSLKVSDVAVHAGNGKRWASLPSRPQLDKDGVAMRDDQHRIKYAPVVQWTEKDAADRFSEAVIQAVEAAHPGDTQGD